MIPEFLRENDDGSVCTLLCHTFIASGKAGDMIDGFFKSFLAYAGRHAPLYNDCHNQT